MTESRQVRLFFRVVVLLNLITLGVVFLAPRVVFVLTHANLTQEEFLTTRGSWDLPNPNAGSFELAYVLRSATPENAHLFLPPAGGTDTYPSALYRVLLPRTLIFGGSRVYTHVREGAALLSESWLVSGPEWEPHGCDGKITRPLLPDTDWVLCRLDAPPGPQSQSPSNRSNVSR